MPKVLALTPTEGESPEEFTKRAAGEIQSFFGEQPADAEEPSAPVDETEEPTPTVTDETADES
jgi:hypothetical protein